MRKPQYSRFKGSKRASKRARANAGYAAAPVTVTTQAVKLTLSLWHKSAKEMGYGTKGKPLEAMPVMTLACDRQTAEPPRTLCNVPGSYAYSGDRLRLVTRDKPLSRDARHRQYAWEHWKP